MPANFSSQVYAPTGEAGKKEKPVLCRDFRTATLENNGWQRAKVRFIFEGEFFKNRSF
jgi:hypothetical protein